MEKCKKEGLMKDMKQTYAGTREREQKIRKSTGEGRKANGFGTS